MTTNTSNEAPEARHRDFSHPDYEYKITQTGRKSNDNARPDGGGWEPNNVVHAPGGVINGIVGPVTWRNWERYEHHEDNFWRRRKAPNKIEADRSGMITSDRINAGDAAGLSHREHFLMTPKMLTPLSEDQLSRALDDVEEWCDGLRVDATLFDLWCQHVGVEPNTYESKIAYGAFRAARDHFLRALKREESIKESSEHTYSSGGFGCETCGRERDECTGDTRDPFAEFNEGAHRLDAPDGPVCRCGQPSTHESGWCGSCVLTEEKAMSNIGEIVEPRVVMALEAHQGRGQLVANIVEPLPNYLTVLGSLHPLLVKLGWLAHRFARTADGWPHGTNGAASAFHFGRFFYHAARTRS